MIPPRTFAALLMAALACAATTARAGPLLYVALGNF